jgi:hypothetical protein
MSSNENTFNAVTPSREGVVNAAAAGEIAPGAPPRLNLGGFQRRRCPCLFETHCGDYPDCTPGCFCSTVPVGMRSCIERDNVAGTPVLLGGGEVVSTPLPKRARRDSLSASGGECRGYTREQFEELQASRRALGQPEIVLWEPHQTLSDAMGSGCDWCVTAWSDWQTDSAWCADWAETPLPPPDYYAGCPSCGGRVGSTFGRG